ncbi:MAG: TetR/AcrR family transcriptional regulator [Hyphomonas sp.]|nr:TetR/AcrR family transcriptional regulator [Hyphomonas sp.]
MTTDTSAPTTRGERTRKLILSHAVGCIFEKGLAATAIEHVIERSGLSRGAILHHFSNRTALVAATAEFAMQRVLEKTERLASKYKSGYQRLVQNADTVWKVQNTSDGIVLAEILQAARWDKELSDAMQPIARRMELRVEQRYLQLAEAAGAENPALMVPRGWLLLGSVRGLIPQLQLNSNRKMILAAVEEMKWAHQVFCEAYIPPGRRT